MKIFASLSITAVLSFSTLAFGGGGSSGTISIGVPGNLECVSPDGHVASPLKNTISVNGSEVALYYLKLDRVDPVSWFIVGNSHPELRKVSVAVPLVIKGGKASPKGSPRVTFTSVTDDLAAELGETNAVELFSKTTKAQFVGNDRLQLELAASPVGLCDDYSAKVQVVLAF